MKYSKSIYEFSSIFFVLAVIALFTPQKIFCQTESLDIIQYTPPKGWTKTLKDGVIVYSDGNKSTNGLCILTVYPSIPTAGSPQKDFANQWNELVVKPFKAEANPKTDAQTQDGWTSVTGAARVESDGVKLAVLMTVITGYGRSASVLSLLNDQTYVPQIDVFMTSIKMDKDKAAANTKQQSPMPTAPVAGKNSDYLDFDPFPDKPRFQPQKPLLGRLRKTITMADLVGKWELGGASVTSYFNSSSGNYSSTDTSFYRDDYVIHPDGSYESKFQGRASNQTIRESDSGTIILDGGLIIIKSKKNPAKRNQFVAFMVQPDGAAILSLLYIGDGAQYNAAQLIGNCNHTQGYISCLGGSEWVRLP
ncbi:MAG TPA: hypothetical protein VHQ01_04655 [Pyrinomonadaceae bacterium]|nr:hypothetical protein [Pyrinomonadaceae bacterium]